MVVVTLTARFPKFFRIAGGTQLVGSVLTVTRCRAVCPTRRASAANAPVVSVVALNTASTIARGSACFHGVEGAVCRALAVTTVGCNGAQVCRYQTFISAELVPLEMAVCSTMCCTPIEQAQSSFHILHLV